MFNPVQTMNIPSVSEVYLSLQTILIKIIRCINIIKLNSKKQIKSNMTKKLKTCLKNKIGRCTNMYNIKAIFGKK